MALTIGTSCAVRMGCGEPIADTGSRIFCYVLADGRFIAGAPGNSGGVVLDWLARSLLRRPAADDHLVTLLTAADTATMTLLCCPMSRANALHLARRASGSVVGLRLEHTAHMCCAPPSRVSSSTRAGCRSGYSCAGQADRLIATGKVLEIDWIRQLAADIFGLQVRFPGGADASATGAATLANIATGQWTWDAAIQRQRARSAAMIQPSAASSGYLTSITITGGWPAAPIGARRPLP